MHSFTKHLQSTASLCIMLAGMILTSLFMPEPVSAAVTRDPFPQALAESRLSLTESPDLTLSAVNTEKVSGPVQKPALRDSEDASGIVTALRMEGRLVKSGSRLRYKLTNGSWLTSAWQTISGKTYYFNKKGYALTGLRKIGKRYYIFNSKGVLQKGWIRYKKHWYYGSVRKNGRLLLGWQKIGGKRYYISVKKLYRLTGFQYIGGKMYYFNSKGVQQTADQYVKGRKVVFNPNGSIYSLGNKIFGTYGSSKGQQVANYALQFVGNPYRWGGSSLTHGADCSGFVMAVYAHFGIKLPHYDAWIRRYGRPVDSLSKAVPGDVICYNGHVAIYIGGGRIVHAADYKYGICIGNNAAFMRILTIRRFF